MARTKGARNADYETKRRELLWRLLPRFVSRAKGRPSLRQFAAAAGVTMPTLRHYFGDRSEVVAALLEEYRRMGATRLDLLGVAGDTFDGSIHDCARALVFGLQAGGGPVRLGDIFSASLAEGLSDPEISPLALRHIVDPAIATIEQRMKAHIERGDMAPCDPRTAALMLLSPILLAVLHQDQMQGASDRPIALFELADDVATAFVRGHATQADAPRATASA